MSSKWFCISWMSVSPLFAYFLTEIRQRDISSSWWYTFLFFWWHSWDVGTLVANNSKYLVCQSVSGLTSLKKSFEFWEIINIPNIFVWLSVSHIYQNWLFLRLNSWDLWYCFPSLSHDSKSLLRNFDTLQKLFYSLGS